MLKNLILEQRGRREQMLSLPYIPREQESRFEKSMKTSLIKVILGPRRSGKSFFAMHNFKPEESAYLNFDDERLSGITDYDEIIRELLGVYGNTRYLFFDEIQNLPRWELFVNRLHRNGFNVLVTGSNAKLLSKELATHLTGRHLPLEILPFNFKEYLSAKKFTVPQSEKMVLSEVRGQLLNHANNFMLAGGFPELVIESLAPALYLNPLLDSLLLRDVVDRYHVRFARKIIELEQYLINNTASEFSLERLTKLLHFNSWHTLAKYVAFLEEAYLAMLLERLSYKAGQRIRNPKKSYVVDNGYLSAKAVSFAPNSGKMMENLVFTELIKRGYQLNRELFYYKTRNDREVDFVLKKGLDVNELIQVAYDVSNPDVEKREVKALVEAAEELKGAKLTIITWNENREVTHQRKKIQFRPLWEWLLE